MKYRKKPVVIEAFQLGIEAIPDWFMNKVSDGTIMLNSNRAENDPFNEQEVDIETTCSISTLEGTMKGNHGDFIIKGVNGEIYPCKPDIFAKTYEALL